MRSPLRPLCAPVGFGVLCLTLLLTGCGQPVRQDRSINWSANGSTVWMYSTVASSCPPASKSFV